MALQVRSALQDLSQNVHSDGFGRVGKKWNLPQALERGSLVEKMENKKTRKPLQELSRNNSENIVSAAGDTGASKAKAIGQKSLNGGRKPLGDLTNSSKPRAKVPSKNGAGKQLLAGHAKEEEVFALKEECFLHDHQKCIKAQSHAMDFDYYLETVGLRKEISAPGLPPLLNIGSATPKLDDTPMKLLELDESFVLETGCHSPILSPTLRSSAWNMEYQNMEFSALKLIDTPEMLKLIASP